MLCWDWKLWFCCTKFGAYTISLVVNVDNMLNALDAERSGNEATKREKLRVQIGFKPNPA